MDGYDLVLWLLIGLCTIGLYLLIERFGGELDKEGVRKLGDTPCPVCANPFGTDAATQAATEFLRAARRLERPGFNFRDFWDHLINPRFETPVSAHPIWLVRCPQCDARFQYLVEMEHFTLPLTPEDERGWRQRIGLPES